MFEAAVEVARLEKALARLRKPEMLKRWVVLHDYDEECYRKDVKGGYARNGFSAWYPDDIVESVLGESPADWSRAFFPKTKKAGQAEVDDNNRYSMVLYAEIAKSIDKSVSQDLAVAKKELAAEEKLAAQWQKRTDRLYPEAKAQGAILHFSVFRKNLKVTLLQPQKLDTQGMGEFLYDVRAEHVVATPAARRLLTTQVCPREGLCNLEIFAGHKNKGAILAGIFDLITLVTPALISAEREGINKILGIK